MATCFHCLGKLSLLVPGRVCSSPWPIHFKWISISLSWGTHVLMCEIYSHTQCVFFSLFRGGLVVSIRNWTTLLRPQKDHVHWSSYSKAVKSVNLFKALLVSLYLMLLHIVKYGILGIRGWLTLQQCTEVTSLYAYKNHSMLIHCQTTWYNNYVSIKVAGDLVL